MSQSRVCEIAHEPEEHAMSDTVSDFMLDRLIYGYPGDGINGLVTALGRDERIEFIQVRHEEMAAFMACAHAKFTGEVSVCMATSGPGAIHLLNGLYDAKMDHQPVYDHARIAAAARAQRRRTRPLPPQVRDRFRARSAIVEHTRT
jgi:pyruvate dehydrogenase (quinone)